MFQIRRADESDTDTLTRLRVEFLQETGQLQEEQTPSVEEATRAYFARTLPSGEFVAFVAEAGGEIVGTSGLIFFERPPSQRDLHGRDGYVLNMYSVRDWRGRGIATHLLKEVILFARSIGVKRLLLHALSHGRGLYERAGFVPRADEMQLRL